MSRVATFDIETDNLLEQCTKVWCIAVKDHDNGDVHTFDSSNIRLGLSYLATFDTLIGHNCIYFDFPVLRKLYRWEYEGTKIDTLIMSRTQRPKRKAPKDCDAGPHSVEAWAIRLGKKKVANDVWNEYHPVILQRCMEDVEIQYQLYRALLEEGKGEGWENAHKLNARLFHYLQLQEEYGWYIDQEKLASNIRMLQHFINRIDKAISPLLPQIVEVHETKKAGEYGWLKKPFRKDGSYAASVLGYLGVDNDVVIGPFSRISFRPVDLDSNKEVKEYLLSQGWKPKEWNINDNGDETSAKLSKDDPFEGIQGSLGRLIAKRVQCRHRLSNLEGWKQLIRPDGRISPKVAGIASTGRLRHKDIVNVPSPHSKAFFAKQMRSIFICQPGWVMVGVDSKGNQIRQLAARMGDPEFTEAVLHGTEAEGTDLHSLNQRRSGAPSRSKAKNFFYGFIFGAGAAKIAATIGIPVKEAKALLERYLNELPLLRKLIDDAVTEWRATAQKWYDHKTNRMIYANGYITGLDGRPILVDSEHKVLCYMLQSDEAIQLAVAYVMFHKWMEKAGYERVKDWGMIIWMHDEFQFECRPEIAEHSAKLARDSITWAGEFLNIKCPHAGESKIGGSWYDTH